jgi:hypothetical protein
MDAMDPIRTLCRRFPTLGEEDARQYVAEAAAVLGPSAAEPELLAWASDRIKADGYDEPIVLADERLDDEGRPLVWEEGLSDAGLGARAILARAGLSDAPKARRAPRIETTAVRRAIRRLLATGSSSDRAIAWDRFGRLLYGLESKPFREAAREAGVSLGTAWNAEERLKRRAVSLMRWWPEIEPEQQSWLDPPKPKPASPPEPPPASIDEDGQVRLW